MHKEQRQDSLWVKVQKFVPVDSDPDLIVFSGAFIANPDLPKCLKLNTPDPATFFGGAEKGYIDYPVIK